MDTDGNDSESSFDYESDQSDQGPQSQQRPRFDLSGFAVAEASVYDPKPFQPPPDPPVSPEVRLRFEKALRDDVLFSPDTGSAALQHCKLALRDSPSQVHVLLAVAIAQWKPVCIKWLLDRFSWDHDTLVRCLFAVAAKMCDDIVKRVGSMLKKERRDADARLIAVFHHAYALAPMPGTKRTVFEAAGPHTSNAMLQDQFDSCGNAFECRRIFFLTHAPSSKFRPVEKSARHFPTAFQLGDVTFCQAIAANDGSPAALLRTLWTLDHLPTTPALFRWVFAYASLAGLPFSCDTSSRWFWHAVLAAHVFSRAFALFQAFHLFRAPTAAMRHRFLGQ